MTDEHELVKRIGRKGLNIFKMRCKVIECEIIVLCKMLKATFKF